MAEFDAAEFMASAPRSVSGSSSWAERYGDDLKRIVKRYAARAPRSVQRHLGPSELGEICDRQVVAKMARVPVTNHVMDPWASIMGTAGHAWMEECFKWVNAEEGMRFLTETRVTPDPGDDPHPGTTDLYDAQWKAIVDWKFLGDSTRAKLKAHGPKRTYFVQLLLYAQGVRNLGLPVERVVLVAWPRTKSTMDETYIWDHVCTPEDDKLVEEVLARTKVRQALADEVYANRMTIMQVPATPSDDSCAFCLMYRPQSMYDSKHGCPGTLMKRG